MLLSITIKKNKYINHGYRYSNNNEYYHPSIIIYKVFYHKRLILMDKPYVYLMSN